MNPFARFLNEQSLLLFCYLIGSVTFILGLKMLSRPESARRGNLVAAAGMGVAILATIFLYRSPQTIEHLHNKGWIFAGLLVGGVLGVGMARRVQMTAMPEMVSLFNGTGGACAMLISVVEYHDDPNASGGKLLIILLGMIIGTISATGSAIAWGKHFKSQNKSNRTNEIAKQQQALLIEKAGEWIHRMKCRF